MKLAFTYYRIKKASIVIFYLCYITAVHAQLDYIRLSASDIPTLKKLHHAKIVKQSKLIRYQGILYNAEFHLFDGIDHYCLGWVSLYPNETNNTKSHFGSLELLLTVFVPNSCRQFHCDSCFIISPIKLPDFHIQTDSIVITNSYISDLEIMNTTVFYFAINNSTISNLNIYNTKIKGRFECESYFIGDTTQLSFLNTLKTGKPISHSILDFNEALFSQGCRIMQDSDDYYYRAPYLKQTKIEFRSCIFNARCEISGVIGASVLSCGFSDLFKLTRGGDTTTAYTFLCNNSYFRGAALIDRSCMNYTDFSRSSFLGVFTIGNYTKPHNQIVMTDSDYIIPDTSYIVPDSNYVNNYGLKQLANCTFGSKSKLIFDPNYPFKPYNLSMLNLDNVDIIFKCTEIADTEYMPLARAAEEQRGNAFNRFVIFSGQSDNVANVAYKNSLVFMADMQEYYAKVPVIDKDVKADVLDKFRYWKSLMDLDALYQIHFFKWLSFRLLLLLSNYGYNGVTRFIEASIAITFFISLMFFFSGTKVGYYMALNGEITAEFETNYTDESSPSVKCSFCNLLCILKETDWEKMAYIILTAVIITVFYRNFEFLSGIFILVKNSSYMWVLYTTTIVFALIMYRFRWFFYKWYMQIGGVIRKWAMCMWLSTLVFINPKFPIKFFHIKGWLFIWLWICWACGAAMLLIFLIFIAAKAEFLRPLFALGA